MVLINPKYQHAIIIMDFEKTGAHLGSWDWWFYGFSSDVPIFVTSNSPCPFSPWWPAYYMDFDDISDKSLHLDYVKNIEYIWNILKHK